MKLLFFNGRGEGADKARLKALNNALSGTGFSFDFFRRDDGNAILFYDWLCEKMTEAENTEEMAIAMLHVSACPDLTSKIPGWNNEKRRRLIIILFSGDPLSESMVRTVIESGRNNGVAGVFRLGRGFDAAVAAPQFKAFFGWLATKQSSTFTVEGVCAKLGFHLESLNSESSQPMVPVMSADPGKEKPAPQELLRPVTILCEGALAIYDARSASTARVPEIAFKKITEPLWWRDCLGLTSLQQAEAILKAELQPRLPNVDEMPSELAQFIAAIFAESPITERTLRVTRDFCQPIAW